MYTGWVRQPVSVFRNAFQRTPKQTATPMLRPQRTLENRSPHCTKRPKIPLKEGGGSGFGKHSCINFIKYEQMIYCTPKISTNTSVLFIKQATSTVVKNYKNVVNNPKIILKEDSGWGGGGFGSFRTWYTLVVTMLFCSSRPVSYSKRGTVAVMIVKRALVK